ncbi:MAG: hypothetical protein EWV76_23975 [Microcystis novacekii Mn_MB_F_20050700_S1]|uniref:Uncharacterized protein n=1 Tax=Microcystis novacekii Mn_MB_F_20050700_S1D TaxID=2486266 RepID=A0A552J8F7_9CHRO|nr:MAG: hypothetical protein EWV76_23975 [Microcystis novacekii Mn_MB_F_20050700_S1]TRU92066.1 MAG: hypothetical protein EWV54_03295 [Microcystis novacekii Mn_MB_F_20050700_S1D]
MSVSIRNETLIETDIAAIFVNCFALERTNQLSLLSDKDLVNLCHPIEPYQVTKNLLFPLLESPISGQ